MRGRFVSRYLTLSLAAAVCTLLTGVVVPPAAAQSAHAPIPADINCSGMFTIEAVPRDTILVTGEQSIYQITYQEGDYIYLNKGAEQGVKAGDEFRVMRPAKFSPDNPWFSWQRALMRAMGTPWEDEGRIRVVVAQQKTSTAQVIESCSFMQRGDVAIPFAERPTPPLKDNQKFDRFAPASGKTLAMIVMGKWFNSMAGSNDVVYVNLGSAQGVKVGDYFRVFRYQDMHHEAVYQTYRQPFAIQGFGSVPHEFNWKTVPREVIGEGIVLRATPNSSTVLMTFSLREIFAGDYVEIE